MDFEYIKENINKKEILQVEIDEILFFTNSLQNIIVYKLKNNINEGLNEDLNNLNYLIYRKILLMQKLNQDLKKYMKKNERLVYDFKSEVFVKIKSKYAI